MENKEKEKKQPQEAIEVFKRKCAGDDREYTEEEEKYIEKMADEYLEWEKKQKEQKKPETKK